MSELLSRPLKIEFAGEILALLPEKAVWWPGRRTLLVADVHCGKDATYRSLGVPVPAGSTIRDLGRISILVERMGAERLIILGDLLHARLGRHPELVECIVAWRKTHPGIEMILVRGNHDRSSGPWPEHWNIEMREEPMENEGFIFHHAPPENAEQPTFAGHVHPQVFLTDFDGSVASTPCFVRDGDCLILPSFGTFTGGYTMHRQEGRKIYIVTPTRVVEMPEQG
jgi:DNA ligase-associated metallophosphoesterase